VWVERRDACRVLVGKHEGKRQLGRSRHTWVADIKMDLQEVGARVVDSSGSGQGQVAAVVNAIMSLQVP